MSMRLGGMRWADHWGGLPLCFLFGLLAKAARRIRPRRREVTGTRPLAVFKFFGLGSILEATPLLRAVRREHAQAPLVFVTFEETGALVRRLGLCSEVLVVRTGSPLTFVGDCLRAILHLRRIGVEAVVDLEFYSKFSTLLSFLSGAHVRIGYHLNEFWRRSLVTHPIYYNPFRHISDVFGEAALQLGVTLEDRRISRLEAPPEARRAAEEGLRAAGWTGGPLLGVNVNAGELCRERRWPLDRFAAVLEGLLHDRPGLWAVLTGAPSERAYTASLAERLPPDLRRRVFVAAGAWSLDAFIAGLSLMDGFLTNDSGPMHMAASVGAPMVTLWGPARPGFIAPQVENLRVLYANYRCSPCVNMFTSFEGMWCRHEAWCMLEIPVQDVLKAVNEMLDEAARPRGEDRTPLP